VVAGRGVMRVGLSAKLLCFVVAALSLPSSPAIAQVQINQVFNEQGPAPSTGPLCLVGTGDAPPQGITCPVNPGQNPALYGTNVGAVQAVAPDPLGAPLAARWTARSTRGAGYRTN
jgi:hypothetical protein